MSDCSVALHNGRVQRGLTVVLAVAIAAAVWSQGRPAAQQPAPPRIAGWRTASQSEWDLAGPERRLLRSRRSRRLCRHSRPRRHRRRAGRLRHRRRRRNSLQARRPGQAKANFENRLALDPEVKCYLPAYPGDVCRSRFKSSRIQKRPDGVRVPAPRVKSICRRRLRPRRHLDGIFRGSGKATRWSSNRAASTIDLFDRAGNFHTEALKVVERLTPIGPDAPMTKPRWRTRTSSRGRGRSRCRCTAASRKTSSSWSSSARSSPRN